MANSAEPSFVCIVSFDTASTDAPGACCGAPRPPLAEVETEVRRRWTKLLGLRTGAETAAALVVALLVAVLTGQALGWQILPTGRPIGSKDSSFFTIAAVLFLLLELALALVKRSATSRLLSSGKNSAEGIQTILKRIGVRVVRE